MPLMPLATNAGYDFRPPCPRTKVLPRNWLHSQQVMHINWVMAGTVGADSNLLRVQALGAT
jgi:hypothetical protein